MKCLLCNQEFVPNISFLALFSLRQYDRDSICQFCLKKFRLLQGKRCQYCDCESKQPICADCLDWQKIYGNSLLKNHAVYRYNQAFHDLMVNYKRYGDYQLKLVLQVLIRDELITLDYDYYVPIPTSPEHQKRRKFDTVSAIFEQLPLTPLLIKKEKMGAQGERNRLERLKAEQGFLLAENIALRENISQGRFLLLDDIYTTGRTLYHARDKLLEAFPEAEIESFSICR